jgi:PAS domain S-box-containing protein
MSGHWESTGLQEIPESVADDGMFDSIFLHHEAVMLLIHPETGQVVNANLAAARFYGYSRAALRQMRIEDLNALSPDEVARRRKQAAGETRSRFTFPHRLASGEVRTVEVHCSPVQWGGQTCLFSIVFDTSEKQRAESFLDYRKRLLELITEFALHFVNLPLNQMDIAIDRVLEETGTCFEVDRAYIFAYDDTRRVVVNTHEWCMKGVEPQKQNLQAVSQDLLPDWVATHRRGEFVRVMNVASLPDDCPLRHLLEPQQIQSLITVPLMAEQECLGFIGFDSVRQIRDWTEDEITLLRVLAELLSNVAQRRWAEQELSLQSVALSSAANAIAITSRDGVVEWVNPAFETMTGLQVDAVVGQMLHWLVEEDQDPLLRHPDESRIASIWETILEGRVWRGERCRVRPGGDRYFEEATLTPVRNESGEIGHFIAIMQDVTERRALQDQLHRAQRLESIGRLAGGIAHDLNNVLSPVLLGAELIRTASPDPSFQRSVALLEASAKRGMAIIRQILTFARGESGMRIPLNFNLIVERILDVTRETFPKNIEIEFQRSDDLPWVRGDSTQLEQVVMNLCVNARDAMPEGGRLRLHADSIVLDEDEASRIQAARAGTYVRLQVEDTGDGIESAVLANIFEPFFTTKDVGQGTGLGLSVVQGIVRAHEGFVDVQSTLNLGTRFLIYFPACEACNPILSSVDSEPIELPRGRGETVLLVDDEDVVREILQKVLETYGYKVVSLSTGKAAVEQLRDKSFQPNLILTDLAMPELDGAMLLMSVKTLKLPVPVAVMTGLLPQDPLRTRFLTQADALIRKPFTTQHLLETLSRLLHGEKPS